MVNNLVPKTSFFLGGDMPQFIITLNRPYRLLAIVSAKSIAALVKRFGIESSQKDGETSPLFRIPQLGWLTITELPRVTTANDLIQRGVSAKMQSG